MSDITSVKDVTTLVVTLPPPPLEEVIKKFSGVHTPKTLAAARRLVKKTVTVKIPRNLMREVFRITGGWKNSDNWKATDFVLNNDVKFYIEVGDLKLFLRSDYYVYLMYRGRLVAEIENYSDWVEYRKVVIPFKTIGKPYSPV